MNLNLKYDSFRSSLYFSASFWTVFVEPGAAPPVHAKIIEKKAAVFHIQNYLLVFQSFNTLMIFVDIRYSFRAGFSMGVENFTSKKVRLNRPPQSPIALMSSRVSSSVVVVLLCKLSPSND